MAQRMYYLLEYDETPHSLLDGQCCLAAVVFLSGWCFDALVRSSMAPESSPPLVDNGHTLMGKLGACNPMVASHVMGLPPSTFVLNLRNWVGMRSPILRRYFFLLGLLCGFHGLCSLCTVVPNVKKDCSSEEARDVWKAALAVATGRVSLCSCGPFSLEASSLMLTCLFLCVYSETRPMKACACYCLASGCIMVWTRVCYTIAVVMGMLLAVVTFILYNILVDFAKLSWRGGRLMTSTRWFEADATDRRLFLVRSLAWIEY